MKHTAKAIKDIIICFVAIVISLIFALYDFSEMRFGIILNILGYVSLVCIPIAFVIKWVRRLNII